MYKICCRVENIQIITKIYIYVNYFHINIEIIDIFQLFIRNIKKYLKEFLNIDVSSNSLAM